MTREEQIAAAFDDYSDARKLSTFDDFEYAYIQVAFEEGAEWADTNPKSQWISVKEDLPCNHQELMKNEYFTVRVFVFTVNKDIRTDSMVKESSGWKWVNAEFNYRYWMLMPELPTKE